MLLTVVTIPRPRSMERGGGATGEPDRDGGASVFAGDHSRGGGGGGSGGGGGRHAGCSIAIDRSSAPAALPRSCATGGTTGGGKGDGKSSAAACAVGATDASRAFKSAA